MFTLEKSNINFLGLRYDANGNKVGKFGFTNHTKKFSIQTLDNLPTLHKDNENTWKYSISVKHELYKYLYSANSAKNRKILALIEDKSPYIDTLERLSLLMPNGYEVEAKDLLKGKINSKNVWYSDELQTIINRVVASDLINNPSDKVIEYIQFHTDKLYLGYITYFQDGKLNIYYCGSGNLHTEMAINIKRAIK